MTLKKCKTHFGSYPEIPQTFLLITVENAAIIDRASEWAAYFSLSLRAEKMSRAAQVLEIDYHQSVLCSIQKGFSSLGQIS